MTTPTETTKAKQVPAFYIFETIQVGGQEKRKLAGTAFAHKKGKGVNLVINGKRYTGFPPKAQTAAESVQPAAAEGESA